MPKAPYVSAGERVDIPDFDQASKEFTREMANARAEGILLDKQSRIVRGFRVEQANQSTYPGRITIHGGVALDRDGELIFDENTLNVSRTVTLEGINTTFYVEIEFNEAKSDVDARAFWDPTVDQGTDVSGDALPDGQEVNDNVATRTTWGWSVVHPISTSNFERDTTPSSRKIPLVKLTTGTSNEITGTSTSKPTTTLLEVIDANNIRVQNAQLFRTGAGFEIDISAGPTGVTQSTLVINTIDIATGHINLTTALTFPANHLPGAIIEATGTSYPDYINESAYGRYRRKTAGGTDYRDMQYRGDEVHGDALIRGHNTSDLAERSDVNLLSDKDYRDFVSAQFQEVKWGIPNPYTSMTSSDRDPAGLTNNFPSTPRYYDRAGGIQPARTYTVTVGDGTTTFGDFNSTDETAIVAAIAAAPSGGTVYVKNGTYSITTSVSITKDITLIFDPSAVVQADTGSNPAFDINHSGNVIIRGLQLERGVTGTPSIQGIATGNTDLTYFEMNACVLTDVALMVEAAMPQTSRIDNCSFYATANLTTACVQANHADAEISGSWTNCLFRRTGGTGVATSFISGVFAGVVKSFSRASFHDCRFWETGATGGTSLINLGTDPEFSGFFNCSIGSVNTPNNIYTTSGNYITVKDCMCDFPDGGTLYFEGASNIDINGYKRDYPISATLYPDEVAISLKNVTDVSIRNCKLAMQSTSSLTTSMIYVECTTGTISGLKIENNSLLGNTDSTDAEAKAVGIRLDLNGASAQYSALSITNNYINKCEVGLYLNHVSGASTGFYRTTIQGNIFTDTSSAAATAQKFGIVALANPFYINFVIDGNTFSYLDPQNTNLISGIAAKRAAITFEYPLDYSTVSNNTFLNIGESSNQVAETAAVHTVSFRRSTLSGNSVFNVYGLDAYGFKLSDATVSGGVATSTISNNTIQNVSASASGNDVFGIYANRINDSTISGNAFETITTAGSGKVGIGIAVGNDSTTAGLVDNTVVEGNSIKAENRGVSSVVVTATYLSILNNNVEGGEHSVFITGGTTASNIKVNNNNLASATVRNVTSTGTATGNDWQIDNNLCHTVAGSVLSNIVQTITVSRISVSGNICYIPTADSGNAISLQNCTLARVQCNNCQIKGGIVLGTGCNNYSITDNIIDTFATAINALDTSAAGGVGMTKDNILDSSATTAINAGDTQTSGNPTIL